MEIPLRISNNKTSIFGVLRTSKLCREIVILLPAVSGTRIGPQRLYVELGRTLLKNNIASFAVDLPPNGDSFGQDYDEYLIDYRAVLINYYKVYLDQIIDYLTKEYTYKEIILLSISVGCIPIIEYVKIKGYSRVVLLSPNNLSYQQSKFKQIIEYLKWIGEVDLNGFERIVSPLAKEKLSN